MISKAKQERIIAAITDGHSLVKACRDAKVSRATLYRYMGKDKDLDTLPIGCQLVTKFGSDNQLLDYAKSLFELYLK